jgi:hypothetical protein
MPYIKAEKRAKITPVVHGEAGRVEMRHIGCAGDLNYAFTMLAIDYIKRQGLNYQNIADVLSSFDGASKEFYRRVASEYEDSKAAENGDVYPSFKTPKYPGVKDFNGS